MKSCKNDESRNNCHQYIYQVERNVNTQKKIQKKNEKVTFRKDGYKGSKSEAKKKGEKSTKSQRNLHYQLYIVHESPEVDK